MVDVVKIRYREIIVRKPEYGRFPEYQVVLNRRILRRTDTREQAERWAIENKYWVSIDRNDPRVAKP